MLAFPEFVGSETVAVCGEGLNNGFEAIRGVKPLLCVQVLLHAFDLGVERFGNEEIGAVPKVFDEALRVSGDPHRFARIETYSCSEELRGR